MAYGAFFLIGLVSALAGLNSTFAAAHGTVVYLLNATSGLVANQVDLGEHVTCLVPYNGAFVAVTTFANLTHIVYVYPNGTQVPITNITFKEYRTIVVKVPINVTANATATNTTNVTATNTTVTYKNVTKVVPVYTSSTAITGTAEDCALYEGNLVVSVSQNGTKLYFVKLEGDKAEVEKEVSAPAAMLAADEALVVYGKGGLYLYKEGNFTELCSAPITAAATMGNVVYYITNNTVYAKDIITGNTVFKWTPETGNATAVQPLSAEYVAVGLEGAKLGIVVLEGGVAKVSIGVPDVYMLAKSRSYLAAATTGMGEGVAIIPLSWFLTK
jgi:hypothetical protein